jgi:hypothetical protein
MESFAKRSLTTFLLVFMILSIFMWIVSYVPTVKTAMQKVQFMLFTFFDEPVVGMVIFAILLLVYFSVYYTNPSPLDLSEKYISNFTNIWIIFMSSIILFAMILFRKQ